MQPTHDTKPPDACRVLCTGDWHGDKSTAGFARFDDVTGSARRAAQLAIELGCDWFGFLGDLTDPEAAAHRCVQFAIELADWLRSRGVRSFWLGGNHDAVEDEAGTSALDALAAHAATAPHGERRVHVFTRPGHLRLGPAAHLYALPHPHRGDPYDPDATIRELRERRRLLGDFARDGAEWALVAGHLLVDAYERPELRGSESLDMPRGRLGHFPVAACRELWGERAVLVNGHYHRAHGAADPVLVPGSLERLTRAEAGYEPRVLVLDLPGGAS